MLFDVLLDARLVIGPHQAPHRLGQQRLLADAVDQVQRVQRVALGLRHLLPFRVTDDGIDVDVPERHLAGEILGHHHHPGHPEEDDVIARHQHVGRQIARQVRLRDRIFRRPAQRGERHQRRREPGIQHVGVAGQRPGIAGGLRLLAGLLLAAGHEGLAILAIPGRNPVSPPQLARNAPVVDVREPVVVGGRPVLGEEADTAGSHGLQRRPGDGCHATRTAIGLRLAGLVDEPLVGQHRFDHLAGTAADRHHVAVLHGIDQQAGGIQIGHHLLARPVAVQTPISLGHGLTRHVGFQVQHHDQRQLVTLGHLVVVEVMRAGDLHTATAELRIHIAVGNHRDLPAGQRQLQQLAVQVAIALILRMHGHGHVTQHRFRTGGGHHQPRQFGAIGRLLRAIGKRIADVPQMAITLGHVHLEVGHCRAKHRIPVHQPLATVDEPRLVQPHEHLRHRLRQLRVHREIAGLRAQAVGVVPVGRIAQPAHLPADGPARFVLPGPDPVDEGIARHVMARPALGRQLAFHHDLRGNAGMVTAHHPVGVVAQHPVMANQRVHQRLLEGMAHVQRAGHIGRRQLDAVGPAGGGGAFSGCGGLRCSVPLPDSGVRRSLTGLARCRCALPCRRYDTRRGLVDEVAAGFPQRVPARLDGGRLETLGQLVQGGTRRGSVGHESAGMCASKG